MGASAASSSSGLRNSSHVGNSVGFFCIVLVFFGYQLILHRPKLLQRDFEAFNDLGGEFGGWGEVLGVFEAVVLEPEDVEVGFVAGHDFVVAEFLEAFGFFALGDGSGLIDGFKVVEVFVGQRVSLKGEVLVGAEVVDPEICRPGCFAGFLTCKEEDVRLHALGVEDAGGQAQEGVDIAAFEEFAADGFAGAAFEEHVVGENDSRRTADLELAHDVLEEVELFVAGGGPEFVALVFLLLGRNSAIVADDGVAAFFAEGRVGEDHVELPAAGLGEGVGAVDGGVSVAGGSDAVEVEVHRAEADHAGDDIGAAQGLGAEVLHLRLAELVVLGDVVVGGEEESAGAAGGIADHLPGLGGHDLDDGADERARREVLSGALVRRTGGLFEQAFVDGALDVHVHAGPILVADHLDHALEVGGVGDFVLGLAEDDADEAGHFAEVFEGVAVVDF